MIWLCFFFSLGWPDHCSLRCKQNLHNKEDKYDEQSICTLNQMCANLPCEQSPSIFLDRKIEGDSAHRVVLIGQNKTTFCLPHQNSAFTELFGTGAVRLYPQRLLTFRCWVFSTVSTCPHLSGLLKMGSLQTLTTGFRLMHFQNGPVFWRSSQMFITTAMWCPKMACYPRQRMLLSCTTFMC